MNPEYYVAALLGFRMTQCGRAWREIAESLQSFCLVHDLSSEKLDTNWTSGRAVTTLRVRSKCLSSREDAEAHSRELTDLLAAELPHQAKLCRPLSKRGFKAWDSIYADMEAAFDRMREARAH